MVSVIGPLKRFAPTLHTEIIDEANMTLRLDPSRNLNYKLSDDDIQTIRKTAEDVPFDGLYSVLARKYRVNRETIRRICLYQTRTKPGPCTK